MSGNQYVYSIEIANAEGGLHRLDLVHKNRKSIMKRAEVMIQKLARTHELVDEAHHRDLTLLIFSHHDRSAVCDFWEFAPRGTYRLDLPRVNIRVRAWVIKEAKPEGPVRGTLKEKMALRPVAGVQ